MELDTSFFFLNNLFVKARHVVSGAALRKKINIMCNDVDCSEFQVLGDFFKLQHALTNLLSNAIKFSPEGSTVTVDCTVEDREPKRTEQNKAEQKSLSDKLIFITIADCGIGISAENISKLFAPYSQINPNQTQSGGGTGSALNRYSNYHTDF